MIPCARRAPNFVMFGSCLSEAAFMYLSRKVATCTSGHTIEWWVGLNVVGGADMWCGRYLRVHGLRLLDEDER